MIEAHPVYRQRMDFNLGFLLALVLPLLLSPATWLVYGAWYFLANDDEGRRQALQFITVPSRREQVIFGAVVGIVFIVLCVLVGIGLWWGSSW